uniref:BTB domain-containing protein n=1 Tax=Panagrolaimus sp. JU765 TaxID=591449 RepID=A0AC34RK09_9BILA
MLDFSNALTTGSMADIVFMVNGEKILAHKFILYFRSPVFKTMFDGPMTPKSARGGKPTIKIDDSRISAENFKLFLGFLYTDKVKITGDNVFELLNMAKMYDIESLVKLCEEFLTNNLNFENVVTIANSASIFDDSKIFKEAINYIQASDVMRRSEKFCLMNETVLREVLTMGTETSVNDPYGTKRYRYSYPRCSEIELFQMLLKWGQNQCKIQQLEENPENMKKILEPFLPLIRFPTMTIEQLTTIVGGGCVSSGNQKNAIKILLINGADPNIADNLGMTPTLVACLNTNSVGSKKCLIELIKYSGKMNYRNLLRR